MKKKKIFKNLKGGNFFIFRSALYLKIGPLTVYKISRKRCKFNVNLSNMSKVGIHPADFHYRSLVIPVRVSIKVK